MMSFEFHNTKMGHIFFEGQIPKLIRGIERIADALEKNNEIREKELKTIPAEEPGISKVLTLSTAHIKESTTKYLDKAEGGYIPFAVFQKAEYGYFIYLTDLVKEYILRKDSNIPDDLKEIFKYAIEKKCDLICLDRDAETIDGLNEYEW